MTRNLWKNKIARAGARAVLLLLLVALCLPLLPTGVLAADKAPVKISADGVTKLALAEVYDSFAGQLYVEKGYEVPYFDSVRPDDTLTFRIDVEEAGTYQWCMITGWAAPHVNGTFTLFIDDSETVTLENKVAGIDWRTWLDTTPGTVELPAGEHEVTIKFGSAGPNVYGMKFAPEGVDMEDQGGTVKLCGPNDNTAVQISEDYGIQFHMTVPFDSITIRCPSWSNNKGSLRFALYQWNENYATTIAGSALAEQDFVDYNDNAMLQMKLEPSMDQGEYVLLITNISEDKSEQVGVWASTPVENVRNYLGSVEGNNAAACTVHYVGTTTTPLGAISANLQETPSFEEITESQKNLSQYNLPASSRYPTATVDPGTWVFTDGLGRVSLTNADVGMPRDGKTLAMFFWNWHATFANIRAPFNVQKYIDEQSEKGIPLEDYLYDYDHAGWLAKDNTIQYFWDEPIYGYYRSDDEWVLRRQAELLTAAGIDVIFTDNSNATLTWGDSYPVIYKTWLEAMADGVDTPKVTNLMPFGAGGDTAYQLREMYTNIYHDGNYRPLWFYWEGKPLIMAHGLSSLGDSALDTQIKDFFTFRAPFADYFVKNTGFGSWGWLSTYPQARYYASQEDRRAGIVEQITVGVAQNANYVNQELAAMSGRNIMGRSYTKAFQDRYEKEGDEASKWGYNFAEQWEYALEQDPKLVFVTGWNEWCASLYASWPDGGNSVVTNAFPDQFNNEFSRDLEPSRGALADHYYYQFVNFARQYKGVNPIPVPSGTATIDMTAGYEQWQSVEPYFAAYIGNTDDRDSDGYKGTHYSDYSGRNDIIGAQVARDGESLWFLVECAADITPYTDKLWMNLYIDVTGDGALDGWNSFDFVVNKTAPTATTAVLEKFTGDGYASEKVADVEYTVDGRYMTVKIPKSALGIEKGGFTVNFAWTDNVHDVTDEGEKIADGEYTYSTFSGDILDFYTSGDVAPGGRFKFSYVVASTGADTEETTVAETSTEPVTEPTTTPDAPADSGTEAVTDTPTSRGCGSSVALSTVALASAVAAAVVLRKTRED